MMSQNNAQYGRIAQAIEYIQANFKTQPSLDEIAAEMGMSAFHFQRLFSEWVGVSPKKFMQYLSVSYAKTLLKREQATVMDAAYQTGFSGSGRLHDLFVNIEGMTPGEFKNGGENLSISYSVTESPFGRVLVASTPKGICHLAFEEDEEQALLDLTEKFPHAQYRESQTGLHQNALGIFQFDWTQLDQIKLHLKGSAFQLKIWQALLNIPLGSLSTYGQIAETVGNSKASRAVGTAIGSNPVAFLIPCHRVVRTSGELGGYRWGTTRKSAMIGWEAARTGSDR